MDLPSFLVALLPVVVIGFVCVLAMVRRRSGRSAAFPLILNPRTFVIEPNDGARGSLPVVPPAPPTTTYQKV